MNPRSPASAVYVPATIRCGRVGATVTNRAGGTGLAATIRLPRGTEPGGQRLARRTNVTATFQANPEPVSVIPRILMLTGTAQCITHWLGRPVGFVVRCPSVVRSRCRVPSS